MNKLISFLVFSTLAYFGLNNKPEPESNNKHETVEVPNEGIKLPREEKVNRVKISKNDLDNIVRCMYGESSEDYADAYKVVQVIVNRYNTGEYDTYTDVISEKKQFSCYRNKRYRSLETSSKIYLKLENVALNVFSKQIPDSLKLNSNIKHFVNPSTSSWLPKMKVVSISRNNHHYYEK
jgi:spore germination cell wall hydrolase CwlJ-like protein